VPWTFGREERKRKDARSKAGEEGRRRRRRDRDYSSSLELTIWPPVVTVS
jgi:hypothetical protein